MKAWILSIVGVIFAGVIIEIIIPEGKTNAFIKSIFAIVFMYIIMSPVINIINDTNMLDFSEIFNVSGDEIIEDDEIDINS